MSSLFVVPCKFDRTRPVIFECIQSIYKYHSNPKILIVDSDSADKSYLRWCYRKHCAVANIHNQLQGFGAHAWAMRHYSDIDFFYLIFDSLIITSNLDHFRDRPLTTIRHWPSSMHDWGWDAQGDHLSLWGKEQLDSMGIPMSDSYNGIMGPMMFAQRQVLEQLDRLGYWFIQTTDKYKQCGMERVAGIVLEHLGYDVTRSLQGVHTDHYAPYDEQFVRKLNLGRL